MLLLLVPQDESIHQYVVCCRDREAVGEDGGELPEHEREASSPRGRPGLPRWHLLQIQELTNWEMLPGAWNKVDQHCMECCFEEEKGVDAERIKTRQHQICLFLILRQKTHTIGSS